MVGDAVGRESTVALTMRLTTLYLQSWTKKGQREALAFDETATIY